MAVITGGKIIEGAIERTQVRSLGSPALGAVATIHAALAVLATGGPQVVTTGITQPDAPRNVTATTAGTNTDVKNVSVTVTGTNVAGDVITEVLPVFTLDTNGTVVGSKAFATITSYSVPAMDGTGATVSIGTGAKLGLPMKLAVNTVDAAFLAGVKEGTPPTITTSTTAVESNTATLSSALNGTAVSVEV